MKTDEVPHSRREGRKEELKEVGSVYGTTPYILTKHQGNNLGRIKI